MDKHVLEKMDGNMRKLLDTDEKELLKRLTRHNEKLSKAKLKFNKAVKALPPATTRAERDTFIKQYIEKHPVPQPSRDILVLEKEKFKRVIRIKAVTRYTGNRTDLENLGIRVRSQAQDIFTISGTRSQLLQLANQPACQSLRTPRVLYPVVEHASTQAEIDDVHDPRPLNPTGFRGNGVLLGIIDSPLDVTHHGFRDPAGAHDSRVLYYWAQSTHTQVGGWMTPQATPPGNTPQQFTNNSPAGTVPDFGGLNYGRIYTNDYINTALGLANPYGTANNQICCEPTSTHEHGTHCAGIAAGSGHVNNWATAPTHVGAAPEATIIHVRLQTLSGVLDTGATFEDSMLDGIDFCLRAAQFHNMPIVISVSQASSFGPHNGQSDFDIARDNFLNSFENRSLVYASGNDNDAAGYRHGSVAPGNGTDSFTMTVQRAGAGSWLDIWNHGPELDYRISFGGSNSGWRTSGQDYNGNVGGRAIEADRDIEPGGDMRGVRIYVSDSHFNDVYTIEVRNPHASDTADYLAWAGLQGWWSNLSGATVNESTISDTGCGKSIITVGACSKVIPPNATLGEQATDYSGAGPTIDGRIKPEIVAVGGTDPNPITSAASDQNSGYTTMYGTSMATPLVAGAVALLFEEYGSAPPVGLGINLDQDTIKALLTQHTNRTNLSLDPMQPGYVAEHRNRYGYGRLRMIGAIDHMLPPVDTDVWIRTADDDYGNEPYLGDCYWCAPDIRVCHAGTDNETTNITWGTTYDVKITVRNLGASDAVDTMVRVKYTQPYAAPNDWFEAEDASNVKLNRSVTVPAMDSMEVVFQWRPEASELSAPAGTTHFCMLAEVDQAADPLVFPAPTTSGGSAWETNIKGVNNVALRNLHIE